MGLYFAPYRWYNPSAARWLTRDPLGYVDGPNVYGYVSGNPASVADVYGLSGLGKVAKICANGAVKRVGPWLNRDAIKDLVRKGEDVWVKTRDSTKDILRDLGFNDYVAHSPKKPQRPHLHPFPHGPHVFFDGVAPWTSLATIEHWTKDSWLEWPGWIADLFNPLSLPNDIVDVGNIICEGIEGSGQQ